MNRSIVAIALLGFLGTNAIAASTIPANPSNYRTLLRTLKPGDILQLAPGAYPTLPIVGLNGSESAWITITGPDSGPPAHVYGLPDGNVIEIFNSSYVSIEKLRIDSRGLPSTFGISAKGHEENRTHHIRVERNVFVGQNAGQQVDAISTKTPTWGWIIRYNQILGAGTGLYLGESDGTQPFVNGLIENNLIKDTIGYNMQIKHQVVLPDVPGMPLHPTSTIIRNNVFIKDNQPSPGGDRPNVLVGGFPNAGPGSMNTYEIYGNYFIHNPREALFQGSGRFSLHDNIFVDAPYTYPAVVLRDHDRPLKVALIYNNTIYTSGKGIYFGTRAQTFNAIVGNVIFSSNPISGMFLRETNNIVDEFENASKHVKAPSFEWGSMDFYPRPGKCQGAPIDLSDFHGDTDYTLDFNGTSKVSAKGSVVYRGAYAGEGENPGWSLQVGIKPPFPPAPMNRPMLVWLDHASAKAGSTVQITATGSNFTQEATLTVSSSDMSVQNIKVLSPTQLTATLRIAPKAQPGVRSVNITTPGGVSNPTTFRIL